MPHKTKSKAYRSTKAHPKPKSKMKAKALPSFSQIGRAHV